MCRAMVEIVLQDPNGELEREFGQGMLKVSQSRSGYFGFNVRFESATLVERTEYQQDFENYPIDEITTIESYEVSSPNGVDAF